MLHQLYYVIKRRSYTKMQLILLSTHTVKLGILRGSFILHYKKISLYINIINTTSYVDISQIFAEDDLASLELA